MEDLPGMQNQLQSWLKALQTKTTIEIESIMASLEKIQNLQNVSKTRKEITNLYMTVYNDMRSSLGAR